MCQQSTDPNTRQFNDMEVYHVTARPHILSHLCGFGYWFQVS